MAVNALAGCTFGDVPYEAAQPGVGPWFDDNCVPSECMLVCCQGWAYKSEPRLRGGNLPGSACEEVRTKNSAYSEYVFLMKQTENWCSEDFHYSESGYCEVTHPSDVIKEFSSDGQPMYAGLSFLVCPPRGQPAAHPLEDVEFRPQE
jgi:hypothetical protein